MRPSHQSWHDRLIFHPEICSLPCKLIAFLGAGERFINSRAPSLQSFLHLGCDLELLVTLYSSTVMQLIFLKMLAVVPSDLKPWIYNFLLFSFAKSIFLDDGSQYIFHKWLSIRYDEKIYTIDFESIGKKQKYTIHFPSNSYPWGMGPAECCVNQLTTSLEMKKICRISWLNKNITFR